jgi:hypothetical protein
MTLKRFFLDFVWCGKNHEALTHPSLCRSRGLGLFGWLPMPSEPAAPVSAKMIDSTAASKIAADYGMLDKNQTDRLLTRQGCCRSGPCRRVVLHVWLEEHLRTRATSHGNANYCHARRCSLLRKIENTDLALFTSRRNSPGSSGHALHLGPTCTRSDLGFWCRTCGSPNSIIDLVTCGKEVIELDELDLRAGPKVGANCD